MKRSTVLIAAVLALVGCDQVSEEQAPQTGTQQQDRRVTAQAPIPPPGTGPDARTPFGPSKRAVDPRSPEAAGQVIQHFGSLIERGRWSEAEALWGNVHAATQFTPDLKGNAETHLRIEKPRDPEGAAGSIYISVPVTFFGKLKSGKKFASPALVTLRRVNDVPGSTEAQRRWHIERIEWQPR